mmetsp:Transcript_16344/g.23172  ORF Transcript_16344/g.23172 Transcript_16344/m.23172 type:complete len:173 (+) Transcript_16344:586-1104(+)
MEVKYWTMAAELGDMEAHYQLSVMYGLGHGVDVDKKKRIHHLEEAAIGGHHEARNSLGKEEWNNGQFERAMKHTIIAAKLGNDESVNNLRMGYEKDVLSEEDFAEALRAHRVAVDAMKSPQRDAAERVRVFALPELSRYQVHVGDRKQNPDSKQQFSMDRPCVRAFFESLRE